MSLTLQSPDASDPTQHEPTEFPPVPRHTHFFPREIYQLIFDDLYYSLPVKYHTRAGYSLQPLRETCWLWRAIIDTSPSLYAIIPLRPVIFFTNSLGHIAALLERSGTVPLTLIVEAEYPKDALALLEPHRARWNRLLFLSCDVNNQLADPHPFLTEPLLGLRTLELFGKPNHELSETLTLDAPSLTELTCEHQPVLFLNNALPASLTSISIVWDIHARGPPLSLDTIRQLRTTLKELRVSGPEIAGWGLAEITQAPLSEMASLEKLTFDEWGPVPCAFLENTELPNLLQLNVRKGGNSKPSGDYPRMVNLQKLHWEESTGDANVEAFEPLLLACPYVTALSITNITGARHINLVEHDLSVGNNVLPILRKRRGRSMTYAPRLKHLHLHHALLYDLEWLLEQRVYLEWVTLGGYCKWDFVVEDEQRVIVPDKAGCLKNVKDRVGTLTLPPPAIPEEDDEDSPIVFEVSH